MCSIFFSTRPADEPNPVHSEPTSLAATCSPRTDHQLPPPGEEAQESVATSSQSSEVSNDVSGELTDIASTLPVDDESSIHEPVFDQSILKEIEEDLQK